MCVPVTEAKFMKLKCGEISLYIKLMILYNSTLKTNSSVFPLSGSGAVCSD